MATINATSLRAGTAFLYEGKPFKVTKYSLIKMGRGGATVKVTCVNIETGANIEHAFSSNLSFQKIELIRNSLQYLYKDGKTAFFMNPINYEQVEVPLTVLGDSIFYLKEGSNVNIMFWDDRAMSVDLPPKVVLKVIEADPGVKGNSASNFLKSAKLENGLAVKVPLFIKVGEMIKVDTRTGVYIERAK
ncbi:elongation factor P [Candidatus Microgenomates bacterium]|nr:elongation factor P [Candidatus Microgenomates bacterium]